MKKLRANGSAGCGRGAEVGDAEHAIRHSQSLHFMVGDSGTIYDSVSDVPGDGTMNEEQPTVDYERVICSAIASTGELVPTKLLHAMKCTQTRGCTSDGTLAQVQECVRDVIF